MHPLDHFLENGDVLHVAADGQMRVPVERPRLIFPGSFNPVHRGHWELARVAEEIVGVPAAFELSVANVDKPPLTRAEVCRRLAQFDGQAPVWLTRAPRFVGKAELFPGATFVVGADTAWRIVAPSYYDESEAAMRAALARIKAWQCRFLVACRVDARGQCVHAGDLPIPPEFRDLFAAIPPSLFRRDLSSTALRSRQ